MGTTRDFKCPECDGTIFDVNPEAFLAARGKNVANLPVKCRKCGFEGKPNEFKKHKKAAK